MKTATYIGVLVVLMLLLVVLAVFSGPAHLDRMQEWQALFGAGDPAAVTIMWQLRLPRLFMAVLSGAALGLSGLLMQTFFRNPLAGPGVLGVSSGATLGVALVALGGVSLGWAPSGIGLGPQVVGALSGGGVVMALLGAVIGQFRSRTALLIFGLMIGYLTGALVTVLQAQANAGALQAFVHWGMGSFAHGGGAACLALAATLAFIVPGVFRASSQLDLWTLGRTTAITMGVDERRLTWGVLGAAGVLAGLVTAWCGPIAFLGLATPHLVRVAGISGRHGRIVLPVLVTGACLALLADGVVRWVGIPLNAVLSMIGAPVVVLLILGGPGKGLFNRRRKS